MTDEDVKAANEALVESMVRQLRDCASVGDEMTLDDACLLDDAADWIAGEPARIAAAREEQREACARFFEATMEQAHDLERDDVDPVTAIRATPLTPTPLGDRIAELERECNAALSRAEEAVRYWTDLAQAEARDAVEARALGAELAEALREMVDCGEGCPACGDGQGAGCGCRTERARAVLAKYEKARGE